MSTVYKSMLCEVKPKYITTNHHKVKISSSKDAYKEMLVHFDKDTIEYQEEVVALYLNRANNTIGMQKLSKGGIAGSVVDGKILYSMALQTGASSIILAHNHPSGNIKPSDSDLKLTSQLKDFGKLINISLIDHLIISNNQFFSLADEGFI